MALLQESRALLSKEIALGCITCHTSIWQTVIKPFSYTYPGKLNIAVKADITVCFISLVDGQIKIAFFSQNANTVLFLYISPWIYCKSTDKTSTVINSAD